MKKYLKKIKYTVAILLAAALVFGATVCAMNLYMTASVKDRIFRSAEEFDPDGTADCILVLGAGVKGETPSHMLEDRLLEAIKLYEAGVAPKIIMSGDHSRTDYDEVNVMKAFAIEHGVPSEDIFMDHAGFSTYESIYRAKAIFGVKSIVIVTQKYHLFRALYISDELGVDSVGVGADPRKYSGEAKRQIREVAARTKDMLWCAFKPEPTYLGETIDIHGSGDVTNDK